MVALAHITVPEMISFVGVFLLGALGGFVVALRVLAKRGLVRERSRD